MRVEQLAEPFEKGRHRRHRQRLRVKAGAPGHKNRHDSVLRLRTPAHRPPKRSNDRRRGTTCRRPASPKKKVGVLNGSAAEAYVRGRLGDKVQVRTYEGSTDAMRDVQNGNIDGTVQDLPPALFYRNRFSALHFVGPPVGKGFYVIYLRKGAERLRDELNAGLLDVIHGGQLRAIYEHYGIWNDAQERLGTPGLGSEVARDTQRPTASGRGPEQKDPSSESNPGDIPNGGSEAVETSVEVRGLVVLKRNLPLLVQAAGMSVLLTCAAMPLAIVAGLFVALGRLYGPAPLRVSLTAYVEILRGTPLLLQLFTIYYVIPPAFGLNLSPFPAAVLGLALNYSAYESEIYRAGLLAIPVGQMEAALSLGMSKAVALRRIIVPQAVRLVIPPVTNDFIALFKDTSICSVITVVELTKALSDPGEQHQCLPGACDRDGFAVSVDELPAVAGGPAT